jgi:hypothetical protein
MSTATSSSSQHRTLYEHFHARRFPASLNFLNSIPPSSAVSEITYIYNQYFGGSAFFYAVYKRAPFEVISRMVEVCSEQEIDVVATPAKNNRFPLHYALGHGIDVEVVKLLIREFPAALREECLDFDDCLYTPLGMSEANGGDETIGLLIRECTEALQRRDYKRMAESIDGDADSIRRMCISDAQTFSEEARVSLLCCLKHVSTHGFQEPRVRVLDVKLAEEMLNFDCWTYIAGFM